jgi:hypothetical protein
MVDMRFGDAGITLVQFVLYEAGLPRDRDQRPFRGVSHHAHGPGFGIFQPGVIAEQNTVKQQMQVGKSFRLGLRFIDEEIALGLVAFAAHGNRPAAAPQRDHGHGVLGECPGFVGTDDGGATQGFQGRELAHQGMAAHHVLHAQGQADGDDGRQTLRYRCDGQTNGGHEEDFELVLENG